uniref:Lipoprotein n=1 Tax=Roseihalotalea indica TaxID=2867963 RepID=A0AA49JFE4_9BACT|nr:hypothetical protein K4G66_21450 [Tunicatimonas sp. TK19036]
MKRILNLLLIPIIFSACQEDPPPNTLRFKASEATLTSGTSEIIIELLLERPADENTPITLEMQAQGFTPGNQFTVDPESVEVNGTIFLAFAKGERTAVFNVQKLGNPPLEGNEKVVFQIASAPSPLVVGQPSTLEINFE